MAAEGTNKTNNFGKVIVVDLSGFNGAIDREELEDGRETVSIWAVMKELVTKGDVRQEDSGVVDLLDRKPHHLEPMTAC